MIMMNGNRRWMALAKVIVVAVIASMLAACGNGGQDTPNNAAPTGGQGGDDSGSQPLGTVTMMNVFYDVEPPLKDNVVHQTIESYTNMKLNVTWVPGSAYDDKVNATIASGEIPDILLVRQNKSASIISAVRSGMFWEIGPYLQDYPNLSRLNADVYNNISIDGKIYGIYRIRPLTRVGITYRKDWADQAGLNEPKTTEALLDMFRSYAKRTTNQDQTEDRYAISMDQGMIPLSTLAVYLGAPNEWGVENDQMIPSFMTAPYMQAMQVLREMYADKLINQDFAALVGNQQFDNVNRGRAGATFGVLEDASFKFEPLLEAFPDAELDVLSTFEGPQGIRVPATKGYDSMFMFSKTSVKTEERLKELLAFMDKLLDKEMVELTFWGIEGRHYELINGKPKTTDSDLFQKEVNVYRQIAYDPFTATPGERIPLEEKYWGMIRDNERYAVNNEAEPYVSDTQVLKGSEIIKVINDAKIKFIMGHIDEAGWEQAVDQWRSSGGDQIMAEYTAEHAKANQ